VTRLSFWKTLSLSLLFAVTAVIRLPVKAEIIKEGSNQLFAETNVPLYVWRDSTYAEPADILIAVHGAAQEGAVFDQLARRLVRKGFLVIAPDVRGSGRWENKNSEPMNIALFESAGDLQKILLTTRHHFPKSDIYLLGESIGAGIVLKAASESPTHVRGLILCSAGVRPHMHNPMNMDSNFALGMAKLTQPVSLNNYLARYTSDDPRIAKEMINDPLGKTRETGLDMLGTFNFLMEEPNFAALLPRTIPVLMLQGAKDQIVEPTSENKILDALQSREKRLVMIPDSGHVLAGTAFIKPAVWSTISTWLKQHSRGNSAQTSDKDQDDSLRINRANLRH
jgi:alpha-beta hydrolase superfamily lysophospholipase